LLPFITSYNLEDAAKISSLTAKGLRLEYITIGENNINKRNKKPGGPTRNLYQGPLPKVFILSI